MRLIDAEALKRLVDEEWFDCQEKSSFFDEIDRTPTFERLKQEYAKIRYAVPIVIPQDYLVEHGEWIEEPNCFYRCSNCGRHYSSIRGYMDYKYCPYCGAKMERSEE